MLFMSYLRVNFANKCYGEYIYLSNKLCLMHAVIGSQVPSIPCLYQASKYGCDVTAYSPVLFYKRKRKWRPVWENGKWASYIT